MESIELDLDTMLNEEIGDEFEALKKMEKGSDNFIVTSQSVRDFCKMRLESSRKGNELEERAAQREHELLLKRMEIEHEATLKAKEAEREEMRLKTERREKAIRTGIDVAVGIGTALVPLLVYMNLFNKTLTFEQTGTVTSFAGKDLFRRMKFGK